MRMRRERSGLGEWWLYVYCSHWPDPAFEELLRELQGAETAFMIGAAVGDPLRLLSIGPLDAVASAYYMRTWEDVALA